MDLDRPHFRTTSIGSSSSAAAPTSTRSELFICFTSRLSSSSSMKLARSILSPGRAARDGGGGGGASLSSSLGRRLRSNGSIKGGQASPFFTTTGKKRGCGFDNPEPSSPKVTCIGQVRVKTKKKVKQQTRSLSRRRSGGGGGGGAGNGEVSFRKIEQADGEDRVRYSNASAHYQQQGQHQMQGEGMHHRRNQRWVHLPVSICEALREFSCLFPCKGSCFSTSERDKGAKQGQGCGGSSRGGESGCGAVFARWLVSVNDGEGGERREIELVVGGADDEVELEEKAVVERMSSMRSSRRHVFEDIEVKDDNRIEVKGQSVEGEEEAARVSICIPPKNALLLMRCRSDPMKMADLAHRFSWDANAAAAAASASKNKEYEDIEEEIKGGEVDEDFEAQIRRCEGNYEVLERGVAAAVPSSVGQEIADGAEADLEMKVGGVVHGEEICKEELVGSNEEMVVDEEENREELEQEIEVNGDEALTVAEVEEEEEEEVESNMSSFEALLDQESAEHYEDCPTHEMDEVVADSPISHLSSSSSSSSSESDDEEDNSGSNEVTSPLLGEEEEVAATGEKLEKQASNCAAEKDTIFGNNDEEMKLETTRRVDEGKREEEAEQATMPPVGLTKNHDKEHLAISNQETKKEKESPVLPDCLLLMMCEPKLSMEVSKETWVCSTDFRRWLPERPRKAAKSNKPGGGCPHEPVKKRLSTDSKPTKPIPDAPPASQVNNDHQQHLQQPPRSSCSLPIAAKASSMATMIEQKLVNATAIEPFVLTRCKSEPMRTSAAKLMPESCFWKNAVRKLEPHRRATVGVGAAGVGF